MHSITTIYRNKVRKNNPRRMSRNRTNAHNKHRSSIPLLCTLVLLLSVALISACMDDVANNNGTGDSNNGGDNNNGNGDSDNDNGDSNVAPSVSTAVTDVTISNITPTALTLNWTNPADSDGFQGVLITAEPAGGTLAMPQQQAASATTAEITNLNPITTYAFTLISTYTDERKNNTSPAPPAMTATSATLPIDADGDDFIDITSLERLNNIRYNLDLNDGRYKTSEADVGVQCGTAQETACRGYELIISLDFANPHHYESGELNAAWRPNSMANNSGSILPQTMADTGQNNGWEPIGTNSAGNAFNSRFQGNGHTISNLYSRRSGNVGLFGGTGSASVIRSVGVAAVRLYRSATASSVSIGALAAINTGIIVASYASGTITGSSADEASGGLVGTIGMNSAAVVASYAAVSINDNSAISVNSSGGLIGTVSAGPSAVIASYANVVNIDSALDVGGLIGAGSSDTIIRATYASGMIGGHGGPDFIGGLIGNSSLGTIVASYATSTVNGGEGADFVGALAGRQVTATASYGFGSAIDATNTIGAPPTMGAATAADLTIDNAGPEWNDADLLTLNAWDFGDSTQAPALRYADYDGDGDKYGCGDSNATIVIPNIVATPTGPMTITCGSTLLPGQGR